MLPDNQEGRLRCYRNALRNWKFRGYVRFKPLAAEWLANETGLNQIEAACALYQHVEDGGVIDEQTERRPEYASYEFHFDLRMKIGDRPVYFETVLLCEDADDPDDPTILVVSVHDV